MNREKFDSFLANLVAVCGPPVSRELLLACPLPILDVLSRLAAERDRAWPDYQARREAERFFGGQIPPESGPRKFPAPRFEEVEMLNESLNFFERNPK